MTRLRRTLFLIPLLICLAIFFYFDWLKEATFGEGPTLTQEELAPPLISLQPRPTPLHIEHPKHNEELLYPAIAPRITMVLVWTAKRKTRPAYLPNFLASVAANPSIDFLIIKYDKYHHGLCDSPLAPGVGNVREVCLSNNEYWNLHVRFFCGHWAGGCTSSQRRILREAVERRTERDFTLSAFRPFRHGIFREWIHPQTKFWGWCDMDIILGSVGRTFPWDIANEYDILTAAPSVQPAEHILLYMVGHMSLLKTAPYVVDQFLKYPAFVNLDAFLNDPLPGETADEGEWSHHAFMRTNLTFLRFPGMAAHRYHISSPTFGVFSITDDYIWNTSSITTSPLLRASAVSIIENRRHSWVRRPTFSKQGRDQEVVLREGEYGGFVWFPKQYAVDLLLDPNSYPHAGFPYKRYLTRKSPLGPVIHRIEPDHDAISLPYELRSDLDPTRRAKTVMAQEMLYAHFQTEKYTTWWRLPQESVAPAQIMVTDRTLGIQVWDKDGRITFDTTIPS